MLLSGDPTMYVKVSQVIANVKLCEILTCCIHVKSCEILSQVIPDVKLCEILSHVKFYM